MLKYHSKNDITQEAQHIGSSAKTYAGAIRYLKKNIHREPQLKLFFTSDGKPYSWTRDKKAVQEYQEKRKHKIAQEYCKILKIETKDIVNARSKKRRKKKRKLALEPYISAAKQTTPSGAVDRYLFVAEYNPYRKMALLRVDDFVEYSRREKWYVILSVLVIYDRESGDYNAIRVSPQCETIDEGIEYLKPAEVKKAEKEKKKVVRQGDMYFIPQRTWNLSELRFSNHQPWYQAGQNGAWWKWDGSEKLNGHKVKIIHPHHREITLNQPHKVKQQITVFGRNHASAD